MPPTGQELVADLRAGKEALLDRARRYEHEHAGDDPSAALRKMDAEIENIKSAVRMGKAKQVC